MKKLIPILLFCTLACDAMADPKFFTTIEEAELYCPSPYELTFTPLVPNYPQSKGTIKGLKNSSTFATADYVSHPKSINSSGFMDNARFRMASDSNYYGYMVDNLTTCLYSYPTIFGNDYALILKGQSNYTKMHHQ